MERLKIDDLAIIKHPDYENGEEIVVRLRHTDHLYDKFLVEAVDTQLWVYYTFWTGQFVRRHHLTKITPETHPKHYL